MADNATVLVFRVLEDPTSGDLEAFRAFSARHGVRIMLQRSGPGEITPIDPAADGGDLWYELAERGLRLTFGPTDFIQVNAEVNRQMIALVLEMLNPEPSARLLDLFCGIGNFTLPLARSAGHVLGIEGDAGMVGRARLNARLNGIDNAEFAIGGSRRGGTSPAWTGQRFDAVLLDPPRAGAAAVMRPLAETGAARIVYVSCHPGTLARDAGTLVNELGYRLAAAGILDMFPATSHVESVAVFERR